jgi:hypothetical protein
MSRLYTHAFLPNLWEIHRYIQSKTLHLNKSNIVITQLHMHIRHSEPLENSNIHALQIYNIPTNSINVISQSHIHTWHSEPLGNSCITSTPNICHLMKSTQRHCSNAHAYMTFQTFWEFMYTFTPNTWHLIECNAN